MAGSWKWKVESKEFELLVKDGASRARFYERNGKRQRSIFLLKVELAWLDRKVEELGKVDNSEVLWDQAKAGYPRIMALKCSNRNGNFLTIEEFDGRRRCGSIMITKGRYGQGWERLKVHVSRANASFRVVREVRESAMVTRRRSFAKVAGLTQNQLEKCFNSFSEPIARVPLWLKDVTAEMEAQTRESQKPTCSCKTLTGDGCMEKLKTVGIGYNPVMGTWVSGKVMGHEQIPAKIGDGSKEETMKTGEGLVTAVGTRDSGKAVDCVELMGRPSASKLCLPVINSPSRMMSNSSMPGLERLKGLEESVGDGQPMLSVRMELLAIKRLLTSLKSEVEGGIERLESVLGLLELNGPKMGLSERQLRDQAHLGLLFS